MREREHKVPWISISLIVIKGGVFVTEFKVQHLKRGELKGCESDVSMRRSQTAGFGIHNFYIQRIRERIIGCERDLQLALIYGNPTHTLAKLLYLYFNQNFFLSKIWLPLWNELMGHIFNCLKYNFNRFTENSNLNAVWPDFLSEIFAQRFFKVSKIFTDWRFTLN